MDLVIVVVTLALGAGFFLHGLARSRTGASRQNCVANLKQIGIGFRLYANDSDGKYPMEISTNKGGTKEILSAKETFKHYLPPANEISSPKVLICPQDPNRIPTLNFPYERSDAQTNIFRSNKNLSYFIGLSASENNPTSILSGDRNITGGTWDGDVFFFTATNSAAGWTKSIHNYKGNVGFADGSANQFSSSDLQKFLLESTNVHRLLLPE